MTPEPILAPAWQKPCDHYPACGCLFECDPLTEAYLEQPSDWWAVPLAFVFGALSVVVLVGAVS